MLGGCRGGSPTLFIQTDPSPLPWAKPKCQGGGGGCEACSPQSGQKLSLGLCYRVAGGAASGSDLNYVHKKKATHTPSPFPKRQQVYWVCAPSAGGMSNRARVLPTFFFIFLAVDFRKKMRVGCLICARLRHHPTLTVLCIVES